MGSTYRPSEATNPRPQAGAHPHRPRPRPHAGSHPHRPRPGPQAEACRPPGPIPS